MADGFTRRSFIKLAATASAAATIPGCQPAARKLIPYVVPDENVIPGVATFYATTCDECPAGCGIIAKVREGRVIKLEGNPASPINQGAICARGQAGLQGLYNPDRLRAPMLRGHKARPCRKSRRRSSTHGNRISRFTMSRSARSLRARPRKWYLGGAIFPRIESTRPRC
jgi:anaerobic selenocysteine-containing dehydrogenase